VLLLRTMASWPIPISRVAREPLTIEPAGCVASADAGLTAHLDALVGGMVQTLRTVTDDNAPSSSSSSSPMWNNTLLVFSSDNVRT
jgi:hypothetical protein